MLGFVGSKTGILLAIVLAVILILFTMIQYIQSAEEDKIIKEIQVKQIEKRKTIDEAVRTSPPDVTDSLQYLGDRK